MSPTQTVVQKHFALLKPVSQPPRLDRLTVIKHVTQQQLIDDAYDWVFSEHDDSDVMAVDIETRGLLPFANPADNYIVGIGFADARGSIYFNLKQPDGTIHNDLLYYILNKLHEYKTKLVAHNVAFEGPWFLSYMADVSAEGGTGRAQASTWLNFHACTYALYKHTATEGWPGQTWNLKDAMKDLLNWEETNETELDRWLVDNDYVQSWKKEASPGYYYRADKDRWASPQKGEMWRAPYEVLGHYCCLDCDSTWLLYQHVFKPVLDTYPMLAEYSHKYFMKLEELLATQMTVGLSVDTKQLSWYSEYLTKYIEETTLAFCTHEDVAPHLETQKQNILAELTAKAPAQHKKDGDVSKNWLKWKEKYDAASAVPWHLNLNSFAQKSWLFYEALGNPVKVWTLDDEGNEKSPAVDEDALKGFGQPGRLLIKQQELVKESTFVAGCLDYVKTSADGKTLHPQLRVPGTLTGRLSGSGGLNVQNMPKTPGYLETWRPRPGKVWISSDWTALEQVVLCALSRDNALMSLYGPGAKPQDVYLFNGSQMAVIGPRIQATGYNPQAPTKESVARAKKECKKERQIAKTVTLASSYGAGPGKIQATLGLDGIDISFDEAKEVHASYWALYKGVKDYEAWLKKFWHASGGWVPSMLGRPVGVDAGYLKDLLNRVVQTSGHDLHVLFCYHFDAVMKSRGLQYSPIIIDYHDESDIEVDEADAEAVMACVTEAEGIVNEFIECDIAFKITPELVGSMAEIKCDREALEAWQTKRASLLRV